MVVPIKQLLINSRKGGCHSCRNSRPQVTIKTEAAMIRGFAVSKMRKARRHQNIS